MKLKKNKRISTEDIEKILIRHKVEGDMDALQRSHRLKLAQRMMASLRDEKGRREVLALRKGRHSEYVAVDFCNDEKELQAIGHRIHKPIAGIENTLGKIASRLAAFRRFLDHS